MKSIAYLGTTVKGLTKEFQIPHPCGFIAGKTWGDSSNKPVLCLHGWLDNCNTFDKLIPLLPKNKFYVAFDFLGHGLSSHLQIGGWYTQVEDMATIKRVIDYFNWCKDVTFLGHSMGGNISTEFAAVYPDLVGKLIQLDSASLFIHFDDILDGKSYRKTYDGYLKHESNNHPPIKQYKYEDAKKRLQNANKFHKLTDDAANVLLERSLKHVKSDLFTFRRDFRLLLPDPVLLSYQEGLSLLNNVKCEIHMIRASHTSNRQSKAEVSHRKLWKESSKKIFFYVVDGHHHVHLNQPTAVASIVTKILNKKPTALSAKL